MATCPVCHGRFENATFCPRDGSRLETAADTGALLGGRYRLIRKVGEGAMGVVFEAEHVSIRRRVAVKILQRTLLASPEMVERLRREAQVTSGLGHPNIVECLDFGTESGQVYLVMEWLDGENLDERLDREPVQVDVALDIVAQTCAGLAEAHERGIVHRDLKPANLFLTRDRSGGLRVKILDFGIAKLAAEHTQLTTTGVLIGTPNYMAPEQALGEVVDARADIYALGVILYELIAGRVPFQGDTPLAVLHQHTAKMPALPSTIARERDISPDLDMLVITCLAKAPAERYQSMVELGAAIQHLRNGSVATPTSRAPDRAVDTAASSQPFDIDAEPPPRRARWLPILLAALAITGIGVAAVVLLLGREDRAQSSLPRTDAGFVPSSIVDAAIDSGLLDAATALPDAALEGTLVDRRRTAHFTSETRMAPERPRAGETVTLTIALADLDAVAGDAVSRGALRVRVTIEHFAKHAVIARETLTLDAHAHASLTWTPRRGKHHVTLETVAGDVSLGRIRFDVVAE